MELFVVIFFIRGTIVMAELEYFIFMLLYNYNILYDVMIKLKFCKLYKIPFKHDKIISSLYI